MKTRTLIAIAVLAMALTGCSSDNDTTSPIVQVPDTAPPAVPTLVDGHARDAAVQITWAANTTDADLDGYKVYRMAGDRAVSLTPSPVAATSYQDDEAPAGAVEYRVTSVDTSGNESSYESVWVNVVGGPNPYHPDHQ